MKAVMSAGLTPVGPLLQAFFIDYLYGQKRASARTVESYRDTFRLLLQFLQQTTGKAPIGAPYTRYGCPGDLAFPGSPGVPKKQSGHNRATYGWRRCTPFFGWWQSAIQPVLALPHGCWPFRSSGPINGCSVTSRDKEMDALLNAHELSQWAGRRDHALLLTLYNTGARVSEMTGLQRSQVQFGTKSFVQFKGKGRKERAVPLWSSTSRTLRAWFEELDSDARYRAATAFPNARGVALSRDGVDYILQHAVERSATPCPSLANKACHSASHSTHKWNASSSGGS